jgi:hypothetical protein
MAPNSVKTAQTASNCVFKSQIERKSESNATTLSPAPSTSTEIVSQIERKSESNATTLSPAPSISTETLTADEEANRCQRNSDPKQRQCYSVRSRHLTCQQESKTVSQIERASESQATNSNSNTISLLKGANSVKSAQTAPNSINRANTKTPKSIKRRKRHQTTSDGANRNGTKQRQNGANSIKRHV